MEDDSSRLLKDLLLQQRMAGEPPEEPREGPPPEGSRPDARKVPELADTWQRFPVEPAVAGAGCGSNSRASADGGSDVRCRTCTELRLVGFFERNFVMLLLHEGSAGRPGRFQAEPTAVVH